MSSRETVASRRGELACELETLSDRLSTIVSVWSRLLSPQEQGQLDREAEALRDLAGELRRPELAARLVERAGRPE